MQGVYYIRISACEIAALSLLSMRTTSDCVNFGETDPTRILVMTGAAGAGIAALFAALSGATPMAPLRHAGELMNLPRPSWSGWMAKCHSRWSLQPEYLFYFVGTVMRLS